MNSRNASIGQPIPSRLQIFEISRDLRRARALIATAAVFLFVAIVGTATTYLRAPPDTGRSTSSDSRDGTLAQLEDYTRSISTEQPAPKTEAGKLLPDVSTMIERLAARLKNAPDDAKGWRMLGWSYFHTERYKEAAIAYARAVELDPGSADLKLEYEEVKAKAAENQTTASPKQTASVVKESDGPSADQVAAFQAMPPHDREASIRAMVDGLAQRLESSPRDVEGWMRLMRSRVVLGEKEVATAALRTALDVFKDDKAASDRITAASIELGLKAQ